MNRDSVLVDVGVGALVTVALSFLPFSSLLGGIAAASHREGDYRWGLGVGAAAGVLATVPLVVLFVPALALAGYLGFGISPSAAAFDLFLGIVALLFLTYTVGLSALGGVVGVWIRINMAYDLDPQSWLR